MTGLMYEPTTLLQAKLRKELAPDVHEAFAGFSRAGTVPEESMQAIWVAAEMRAGGAYAHSTLALNVMEHPTRHTAVTK